MVVDPNLEEEAAASGLMTVIMNAFGELCAVQKTSGIGLPATEVQSLCLLPHSVHRKCEPWRLTSTYAINKEFSKSQNRSFVISQLLAYVTVLLCKPELRYRGPVHFGVHGLPSQHSC